MQWLRPGLLWWAIPAAAVIVLLYMLRMRRRDVRVPASFLWPDRTTNVRANALIQWPKPTWLMALQILVAMALIAALAHPQVQRRGLGGKLSVLVIDTSASMRAREGNRTRLELAIAQARGIVSSMQAGDRLAAVEAGPEARVIFPISSDPALMNRALNAVEAVDAPTSMENALRLAAGIAGDDASSRIIVLSDGVFEPVSDLGSLASRIQFTVIGQRSDNLAINALGSAVVGSKVQVFSSVKNFGDQPATAKVNLFADGKLVDAFEEGVAPGASVGRTVEVPSATQVLEARIVEGGGALESDDYAAALVGDSAQIRVLVVGQDDFFLDRVLSLDPRVTLDRAKELPEPARSGAYDVVVFDGVAAQPVRASGVLELGAKGAAVGSPRGLNATNHPLGEDCDFASIFIGHANKLSVGDPVIESDQGPIATAEDGPTRRLRLGFMLGNSDLPLQPTFPIFMSNALSWLAPRGLKQQLLLVAPGTPFARQQIAASANLKGPGGSETKLTPMDGQYLVRGVTRVGEYSLSQGEQKERILASMRDDRESKIGPRSQFGLGGQTVRGNTSGLRAVDLWPWVVGLALVAMLAEWALFARQS